MVDSVGAFYRGAGLVYDNNARRRESELLAAQSDELRRAEIARREYVNRMRKGGTPQAPDMNRAGLQMRDVVEAPIAAPVVPPNAPDSGIRIGVPRRRRGGPDINAPNPTNVGPTRRYDAPEVAVLNRAGQAAPMPHLNARKSEEELRSEYPKPGDDAAPPARAPGVTPPANRVTPTASTGGRAIFLQGGTRNANGTVNTGDHAHISLPPHLQGRADEVAAFLRQNGVTVNSTVRTNNAGREHPVGNAIDVDVSNPAEADQVFQLIAQSFPETGGPLNLTSPRNVGRGGTPPPASIEQVYAAVQSGPEGLPYVIAQMQEERFELQARYDAALAAGIPEGISAAHASLRELNTRTVAAYGAAAATDIGVSGNTELWSQYFQAVTGRSMTFQPYADGTYQVYVDGQAQGAPMTRDELQMQALSMVDAEYRQRNAETAAERSMAEFESNLRRRENYESAMFDNMTQTQVARIRAEAQRQTGAGDVEFQDIETAEGPATVAIYTDPQTGQRVMSRVSIEPRRSPSARGNSVEVPTLVLGGGVPIGGG